ncbi:MAG TPA: molybdenum cofactor guanylyltransferase MobA [Acetobacteraceae bacterium]|nr:molybdenum cofactor guanylyltransferase MobA [Acetobacteraceae bacterium]
MIKGRPAALILAGGRAERLGGAEKPLLPIGERTILERILTVIADETSAVALSANGDPARFASFGLPVLPDGRFFGQGPLAGLLAGLEWAASLGAATLLSIPGDTPFLPKRLATRLAPAPSFAASGGRAHYLVALWPLTVRAALAERLTVPGPRSVARFAAEIGSRIVEFPAEPQSELFFNINTPADLARARAMVAAKG